MYKPGWHTILGRSTKATIEQCLLTQYKNLSNSLDENELESCQNGRHFLKKCWDLPFYGLEQFSLHEHFSLYLYLFMLASLK